MEISDADRQKAESFIERLMANPALQSFSLLQKEEQILQFLTVNARQLYPTLSSPAFFGGRSWEDIWNVLTSVTYDTTNRIIIPEFQSMLSSIDLTFFTFLRHEQLNETSARELLGGLVEKAMGHEQARRVLAGSYSAIKNNVVRRFVPEVYRMKKYIHFELTKVERLKLGEKEALNMISLVVLLKPAIYIFSSMMGASPSVKNTANGHIFMTQYTRNLASNLIEKTPSVPPQVLLSAMNANASFADDNKLEATARLSNILCSMCRNYKSETKKDRGADTEMKSWITVARRNYKFYGYDIKMLDELYNIASDNGW